MDDERNEKLFKIIQGECLWKNDMDFDLCYAVNLPCKMKNCMPFKFALFFNRPEVRND